MTETNMTLIDFLQKHDDGDFLRAVSEAVLQTLMEHDVEGMIGAGRYERGEGRQTYRNGYRVVSVRSDRYSFQRHGSRSSTLLILWSGMRARVSASQAWGSTALSLAVSIRV